MAAVVRHDGELAGADERAAGAAGTGVVGGGSGRDQVSAVTAAALRQHPLGPRRSAHACTGVTTGKIEPANDDATVVGGAAEAGETATEPCDEITTAHSGPHRAR